MPRNTSGAHLNAIPSPHQKNIMRSVLFTAITLVILSSACQKDNTAPAPNNNGGGGNGGSSNNGAITSWTPQRPYPDENITFKGSGFGTNSANVHVYLWGDVSHPFTVLSVHDTELVVAPPANLDGLMNVPHFAHLQFISPAGTDTVHYFYWKAMVNLVGNGLNDPEGHLYGADIRAGDSIIVHGTGLGAGATVLLGTEIIGSLSQVDSDYYCYAYGRLLPDAFDNNENDETVVENRLLTVTNADGRSDTATVQVGISPHMQLAGIVYNGPASFLSGSAESFNATIEGRYLKSCVTVRLQGPGGTFDSNPVGGGFPNSVGYAQPIVSLAPGIWTVTVHDCAGGLGGQVSFTVL